ncbi:MAG: hypothetical protein U0704_01060 [Candidatus Eisenbacteria bacterium]
MTRVRRLLPLAAACLFAASPAFADLPAPLSATRFAFPGSVSTPASAVSAGLALADRWVSADVANNPAAPAARGVVLSPQLVRISRQDLSSQNREYEQVDLNPDFAGAQLSVPMRGLLVSLYVVQPQLRTEQESFVLGRTGSSGPSGSVKYDGSLRETRGGLAVSRGAALRWGAAVEMTRRDDRYQVLETSGSPDAGTSDLTMTGSTFGGAVGVRWERTPEQRGGWVLGAGVHVVPALSLDLTRSSDLNSGSSRSTGTAERGGTFEAGGSARWTLSPESGLFGSFTQRSAEKWDDFGVQAGAAQSWGLGVDFRDPETSWGARLGYGQDLQPGTPEPRANALGAGFTWYSGETTLDFGALHRSVHRAGLPTLSDDRLVVSVRVAF